MASEKRPALQVINLHSSDIFQCKVTVTVIWSKRETPIGSNYNYSFEKKNYWVMMFIIYAERPLQYRSFPHSCDLFNLYPSSIDLDKSLEPDSFSPWIAYTKAHLRFSLIPQKKKEKKKYNSEYKKQLRSSRLKKQMHVILFSLFCMVWLF